MKRVASAIALIGAAACGPTYDLQLEWPKSPVYHWTVGDTLRLVATEWKQEPLGGYVPAPSSKEQPSNYGWASSDPSILEAVAPGTFVMRKFGQAVVTIKGPQSKWVRTFHVCAPGTRLRLEPREVELNRGDTVTVLPIIEAPGIPCDTLDRSAPIFGLTGDPGGTSVAKLVDFGNTGNRWVGDREGVGRYAASHLVGNTLFRDTVTFTVRNR